nr:SH3 domain-containing protein [Aliamphritea spongicola]
MLAVIGEATGESALYVPKVPDDIGAEAYNSRVTANSLRVRAGAGTSFGVIGRLVNDQQVIRLKQNADWSNIRFKENGVWQEGWVASKYLAAM